MNVLKTNNLKLFLSLLTFGFSFHVLSDVREVSHIAPYFMSSVDQIEKPEAMLYQPPMSSPLFVELKYIK